ncbi:MAG TPA: integrase DNA-binding domain-containing protein, partial [Fervidobacterium nodosum]|nr:integrase DNA-binding domain-containing protein [Fervidobacterium nodosum]
MERRKDNKGRVLREGEYQRKDLSYEYRWRDKSGKRHSIYAPTLDELREKEKKVQRNILDGIVAKTNIKINDLYERWKEIKRGIKKTTYTQYCYLYERYIKDKFGQIKIDDLKRTDIKAIYNYLIDKYSLKKNSISSIHIVLHQVLDIAVEDELLRYNPADNALKGVECVKTQPRKALTMQEQTIFENYLSQEKASKWRAIFTVMLYTGMRVGETIGIRWCDIDLEKDLIDVNHNMVQKLHDGAIEFMVNSPKTAAGKRKIPMLPKVKEAFLMEKERQKELGLTCKVNIGGYTDFIFLNDNGNIYDAKLLNFALERIIKKCNNELIESGSSILLPHISCHTLRHTFAT